MKLTLTEDWRAVSLGFLVNPMATVFNTALAFGITWTLFGR
ncbi:MAG: hypothetical protein QN198_01405 [Armatimonadota bacterium]|nr:hypothetical protein [Armatimonadota bacterium]MDR5702241.1 hypothetical protein [Armatimonadota bacterium]